MPVVVIVFLVVFVVVVVIAFVIIIKEIINSMIYIIPSYIVLMQSDTAYEPIASWP